MKTSAWKMLYIRAMLPTPDPAEPFSRSARRRQRDRAASHFAAHSFLADWMADDIAERIADQAFKPQRLLDLGARDGRLGARLAAAFTVSLDAGPSAARTAPLPAIVADEDRLPFADASFDCIVSAASLHGVNDLPGALIQIRRLLRPGGLFVAAFVGGETLRELRHDLIAAEDALTGRAAARILPMVDGASAPGLLQRAGFAAPVSEVATLTVRYTSLRALTADLRGMGEGNVLHHRAPLRRDVLAHAAAAFAARADSDGKVSVAVQVITLTGWAAGAIAA